MPTQFRNKRLVCPGAAAGKEEERDREGVMQSTRYTASTLESSSTIERKQGCGMHVSLHDDCLRSRANGLLTNIPGPVAIFSSVFIAWREAPMVHGRIPNAFPRKSGSAHTFRKRPLAKFFQLRLRSKSVIATKRVIIGWNNSNGKCPVPFVKCAET